jgi:hypothetical protein
LRIVPVPPGVSYGLAHTVSGNNEKRGDRPPAGELADSDPPPPSASRGRGWMGGTDSTMMARKVFRGLHMDKIEFGRLLDQAGLTLSDAQKSELFAAYPMFQAMIARGTPPLPREAEPSVIFVPEVK